MTTTCRYICCTAPCHADAMHELKTEIAQTKKDVFEDVGLLQSLKTTHRNVHRCIQYSIQHHKVVTLNAVNIASFNYAVEMLKEKAIDYCVIDDTNHGEKLAEFWGEHHNFPWNVRVLLLG